MINLEDKYSSYIGNPNKGLTIDGVRERVTGYGYHCDGSEINASFN